MACARVTVLLLLLLGLGAEVRGAGAPPVGAPAPAVDCSSAFLDLADCLSYVRNGQSAAKPEGQCCPNLKKVVKEEVSCLCEVFKQGANFGINITKALTLPSACGVSTPSVTKCNLDITGVPAAAPAPSPSLGAPSSVSSGAPSSVSTGAPSPPPSKSAASFSVPSFGSIVASIALILSSLIICS